MRITRICALVTIGVMSLYVSPLAAGGFEDCNSNGFPDSDDIAGGTSMDCNGNGTPDECEIFLTTPLKTTLVVTGISSPTYLVSPPGDLQRMFVTEQNTGRIRIIKDGVLLAAPFLDIGSLISSGGERGLLSMAFHPEYATNRKFYVNYTNTAGDTVIRQYFRSATDPDLATTAGSVILITIDQPFSNHNGGQLQFGPDDMLYIGMGDGGSGGDPLGHAQNLNSLLGKMLRLDVDAAPPYVPPDNPFVGVDGRDEVWAYGLRNPWRFSFDRLTGDMYIADVGQNSWEEVDFQSASSNGGENYGWRCYEGTHAFSLGGCDPPSTMVFPIVEYSHSLGCSVTGGYCYRGCEMPDLSGTYFYADYCSGRIWSFRYKPGDTIPPPVQDRTTELSPITGNITTFGEDAAGEVYILTSSGRVYKIVEDDPCGTTATCPDADVNCDNLADGFDIAEIRNPGNWLRIPAEALNPRADVNEDNIIDGFDIAAVRVPACWLQ